MDKNLVYLVQTDTTVGFLSSNDKKLSTIKQRDIKQKTLQVVDSLATLKTKVRVPNKQKNTVRRAKQTTFIYPNSLSFRVVNINSHHHKFIKKFGCLYSTSANITKQDFEEKFATDNADIILYNKDQFSQTVSSSIYKINNKKIKRIR
ncbi:MAG: Sua5 YciO YrdC YwlC family protein [Campylobacterota bacterium]|nr:Sua5 YciO YrdC YwlC family protein [Campylobacterota bacterium]